MEGVLDIYDSPSVTSSGAKRIRKGTACATCRIKKRRCNAAQPVCSSCTHYKEPECVYSAVKTKPSKHSILQKQIDDLETQLGSLQTAALDAVEVVPSSNLSRRIQLRVSASPASLTEGFVSNGTFESWPPALFEAFQRTTSHESMFEVNFPQQLPLAPGTEVDPLIGSWWSTDEPPPSGLVAILIKIFAEQEHQHTHDPRPNEFYNSLYDPNPETGLHPALRNAIFLFACGFRPGPLNPLEAVFLRRTICFLRQALARVDRLLDFIEASMFLAFYYAYKGRYTQSVNNIAVTATFAAACGLHAMQSPAWQPANVPLLLPHPFSRDEIKRRIRVWWMIFTTNRLSSSASNIEIDINDEKITTIWELPPESDDLKETSYGTVSSLFIRDSPATYVYGDTANAIRSKCAALVGYAVRLGAMAASTPESNRIFWENFQIIDEAIRRVTNSLPSIFEQPRYEAGAARFNVESQSRDVNRFIIVYHFLACDAVICLHSRLARLGNTASRDACLEASWRVIPAARQLHQDTGRVSFSCLTVVWARMFREFGLEYNRLLATGDSERAQLIIPELKVLFALIKERSSYRSMTNTIMKHLKLAFPSLHNEPGLF
ncbi:hypothetical protein BOTBODRAFT_206844 [Botryobasidium botryosum FD-172 SS1]|uniref:Zn(2)-C6 fungal-type domain-containing protein n=1 Tax=Botryobasidium botryosum (strain FD-172 SS1) TaxID=930990 RepID=A0A067N3K4_BOTB1|nr:hypothetical protein BOTBODRAFT_206844 [Botryobasidium botryosum FD-172 SS1]